MSQCRSDLHTSTNFFIYIFPPNLYSNRLDAWKTKFLIDNHYKVMSETLDTVAFVRILWCSCRVFTLVRLPAVNGHERGVNLTPRHASLLLIPLVSAQFEHFQKDNFLFLFLMRTSSLKPRKYKCGWLLNWWNWSSNFNWFSVLFPTQLSYINYHRLTCAI